MFDYLEVPHCEIHSTELASWLEDQEPETWWDFAGKCEMVHKIHVPCQTPELIGEFRRQNRPLIVLDPKDRPEHHGQIITKADLDLFVRRRSDYYTRPNPDERQLLRMKSRIFHFCWKGVFNQWALFEELALAGVATPWAELRAMFVD